MFGMDSLPKEKKRIKLVLCDANIGDATKRKLNNFLQGEDIRLIKCKSGYIAGAVHREKVKLIAITNESLASAILQSDELGIITEV